MALDTPRVSHGPRAGVWVCACACPWGCLVQISLCVLQMKMPSKKFAHIPVYTLGFESPRRVPTTNTTPTQRTEPFQ